jgi:hypothetical protein
VYGRSAFEYVIVRVVPRVERGECINAGVIVICRQQRFLAARIRLDRQRLLAVDPALDADVLYELERQLDAIARIAAGNEDAGPIARLSMTERWHWLSAPSSTMIQPSPVHTGLCENPRQELDDLFAEMVETSGGAGATA